LAVKRAIRTPQVNPIRSFRLAIMRGTPDLQHETAQSY
jgi:hypothetical protein